MDGQSQQGSSSEHELPVNWTESRFERLFNTMLNGFAHCWMRFEGETPKDFLYLKVNRAFETQTGLKDVTGRWVSDVIPGIQERDPELFTLYGEVARTGIPTRFETFVEALGDWFDIAVYSPGPNEFVAIFDVITSRKRLELDLRESEARHRTLFDTVQQGIIYLDMEGKLIAANPCAEQILGRSLSQMMDMTDESPDWNPIHEDGSIFPASEHPTTITLRDGIPVNDVVMGVSNPRTGSTTWICINAMPVFLEGQARPNQVYATFRDVTDQRRTVALQRKLEEEIQHAQKLESLGSLASGIAHDVNNILAAIQAVTETLRESHAEVPGLDGPLETIERAADRGRDTVQRLTNFARKGLNHPEVLDLNNLIQEEMNLLRRTTLNKVNVSLDLANNLPSFMGERGNLASMFMNICLNSVDAMPHGGTLTIRSRALPDDNLELVIADTGVGMPPEIASRATEPFFTTKGIGHGTGMGLAMATATVRAHGGSLSLVSEVGSGTTVTIRLPGGFAPTPSKASAKPATNDIYQPKRILFVDDDELIRASLPALLERFGHHVIQASGGKEAMRILESGITVDILILYLNMPEMNGAEVFQAVRRTWRELPIVLATGHLDDETAELIKPDHAATAICKPFKAAALAKLIDQMFLSNPTV